MHMQARAHTQRKAMFTYAHNKDHMAVQYSPAVTYCMQGNWHNGKKHFMGYSKKSVLHFHKRLLEIEAVKQPILL